MSLLPSTALNGTVIFDSATQINVVIPAALGTAVAADVVVRIDGKTSNSFKTTLALNAPGIFNPGIENADGSINSAGNPAAAGSFVAVYLHRAHGAVDRTGDGKHRKSAQSDSAVRGCAAEFACARSGQRHASDSADRDHQSCAADNLYPGSLRAARVLEPG